MDNLKTFLRHMVLIFGFLFLLSACSGRTVLFKNLSQQEGNEIYSALLAAGVPVEKKIEKEGISISVPEIMSNESLEILKAKGLPRDKTTSIGEIFKKDSMISSPLEERARYLYGLSQELESTLMRIDGVLAARVHIVLSEQKNPGEPVTPASAAVFIKYVNGSSFPAYKPKVREMVFNAIPGLAGDPETAVKIADVASEADKDAGLSLLWYGPMALRAEDRGYFLGIVYGILVLWGLSLGLVWLKAKDGSEWPESLNKLKEKIKK